MDFESVFHETLYGLKACIDESTGQNLSPESGVMMQVHHPRTWDAKAGRLQVRGQPGLFRKDLSGVHARTHTHMHTHTHTHMRARARTYLECCFSSNEKELFSSR